MNTVKKMALISMVGYLLMVGTGCAPTLVASSTPQIQAAENSYYSVQFEPLKDGYNFFAGFRLEVTNKTLKDFEIDWNKTRYLYNGRDGGIFVFMGIRPEDIKNSTIPPDIIPAGQAFSKRISPYRLLARAPLARNDKNAGEISSGPIPNGENGIVLFVRQNGNAIQEKLTVKITEQTVQ
ncbi:MAG: hypothetical protein WBI57_07105 [Desulfobacterales bacterium]